MMFLTKEELREMTLRTQYAAQVRALRAMGITFKIRADGSVAVLRAHVEEEFGGRGTVKAKTDEFQPNWEGINDGTRNGNGNVRRRTGP